MSPRSQAPALAVDARAKLLETIRAGIDRPTAAVYVGLSVDALEALLSRDQALRAEVEAAEIASRVASLGSIAKAARSGNVRAATILLEQQPAPVAPARCGATTRTKDRHPCSLGRGFRTDHPGLGRCWLHGGRTPNGRLHAQRLAAAAALATLGIPIETDPQTALIGQVWEAMGNVAFLRARTQELEAVHAADHLGDSRPHVLVTMYGEERDRLARLCKMVLDTGIAQKQLDLMERMADPIVVVVLAALEGLPAPEQDRRRALAVAKLAEFAEFDIMAAATPAESRS